MPVAAVDALAVDVQRGLRHPLYAADIVFRKLTAGHHQRRTAAAVASLRRDHVERCWCGGALRELAWHARYGTCESCGGYVNRRPPAVEDLALLYSLDFYWHGRVRTKGQPPIERRPLLDRTDGRVDYWLGLVERYAPWATRVLEVGCGSGVLLAELGRRGHECIGVEPDPATAAFVSERTGVEIRAGLFPLDGLPEVDLFLAFDVLEHARDPQAFLTAAAELLSPGGIAIVQTPVDRYPDVQPPFGDGFAHTFDDVEHCYLFTDAGIRLLAERSGLDVRSLDERLWTQHEICVLEKPVPARIAVAA
jgi:SAM-dependent methyltransferase